MHKIQPQQLATILVVVFSILGVASWSWGQYTGAEKSARILQIKQREWEAMRQTNPAPVAEVAIELNRRSEQAESALRAIRRSLGGATVDPVRSEPAPEQRADAFFAIAQFVEAQRKQAEKAGVKIPEGTSFGFSDYTNSGPETELIGLVHRQRLVLNRLLDSIWKARPVSLTRIQREVPQVPGQESNLVRRGGRQNDYLDTASLRKLRREGVVDTLTFRIGFVGKTSTLRRYLRHLAESDVALVVRGLEVEPVTGEGGATGGVRSLADLFRDDEGIESGQKNESAAVPIIESNESEFLVTIEYLDFEGGKRWGGANSRGGAE